MTKIGIVPFSLLFLAGILFILGQCAFAQNELPKFSARVQVTVEADEPIKSDISSFISRELRSLHDVIITDSKPEYLIRIVAAELTSQGDQYKPGVVLSVIFTEPFPFYLLRSFMSQQKIDEAAINSLESYYSKQEVYKGQRLQAGPVYTLHKICEQIVNNFDSEYLEPARKGHQTATEIYKKIKKGK
jgi:hypothetical protein